MNRPPLAVRIQLRFGPEKYEGFASLVDLNDMAAPGDHVRALVQITLSADCLDQAQRVIDMLQGEGIWRCPQSAYHDEGADFSDPGPCQDCQAQKVYLPPRRQG